MFIETGLGAIREHILIITHGDSMKTLISNPTSAAITSFVLSMPIGLTSVAFMFEIDELAKPLTALFTSNGYDLDGAGRIFMVGGLLLLPVAFLLNLIVGSILLLLLVFTWGGLLLEEIYCLQGIRCD